MNRRNEELNDAIDALDEKLASCGFDIQKAWASLTDIELQFIIREVARCLKDPRYYLENYHTIRTKGAVLQPLWPFWDSQELVIESFTRQYKANQPIRIVILKARQLGITTISVALMSWIVFFRPNVQVISMSDEDERVEVNFDMARTAFENLPWWMKVEKRYDVRGQLLGFDRSKDSRRATSPGMRSLFYFESANQISGAAYSKSLFGAHLAEVARYRNSAAITEGILGSLVNYPRSVGIMESTARRSRHSTWHRIVKAAQSGKLGWDFIFMEWFREPGYSIAVPAGFQRTSEEQAVAKKIEEETGYKLTDGQLAWRRAKMAEFEAMDGDVERFYQEFPATPTEAFTATGRCAFPKGRLNRMMTEFCRPPRWRGEITLADDNKTFKTYYDPGGRLSIWEFPIPKVAYYIGADPSMGIEGGDPACAQVLAIPDDLNKPIRQVARWHGYSPPSAFARILAALGYMYNTAEISPECNIVTTVASDLVKVLMYPNWYRWMREDKAKNAYSNWIGWQTTWRNKSELIARFREALMEWTVIVRCEEDIDEMLDFVEEEEGTERFSGRDHDDAVMAFMIAYYCATQLRPRLTGPIDETPPPKDQDYYNTDYSILHDKQDLESTGVDFETL